MVGGAELEMGAKDKILLTVTQETLALMLLICCPCRETSTVQPMSAAGTEMHTGHRELVKPGACW